MKHVYLTPRVMPLTLLDKSQSELEETKNPKVL